MKSITFIIFSKNRPLQLHALLRSLHLHCDPKPLIYILYATDDQDYYRQYSEVFFELSTYLSIIPVWQTQEFSFHVKTILRSLQSKFVSFLVDDIIFIRPLRVQFLLPFLTTKTLGSLRLGQSITYSYMLDENQDLPPLKPFGNLLRWKWNKGGIDWQYPFSLDGNVFVAEFISKLIRGCGFTSPNSLEDALQKYSKKYQHYYGLCFPQPVLVNIPANKVQTDLPNNRSGSADPKELSNLWDQGYQIDITCLAEMQCNSVHVEVPFTLEKRPNAEAL